ncbi:MAG TPA: lactate utilization protein [Symbiobacteriaceae bacterium]|jgi:L-lactate dehydrogenase complex protein LldG
METLVKQFVAALEELTVKVAFAAGPAEAQAAVVTALQQRNIVGVIAWDDPLLDEMGLPAAVRQAGIAWIAATPDMSPEVYREAAAHAGAGVTGADWAVADTGTLALMSGPGRPRSASLVPPVHIAMVRKSRLRPNAAGLFKELTALSAAGGIPSALNLVTGPSRTADIEHILVRKVHGPGELITIVLEG